MQSFTGRVHPQQTYFDPTASKIVRFVTRNATPSIAKPGNRVEANLKQMYAMMMIKDAGAALPQERLRLLEVHGPKMYEMGKTIEAALDEQVSPELAEQIAQAIDQNIPLTDPKFPQVPELKLPEHIKNYVENKGDDALSVLEGLIDYKNFVDNMKAGRPHASFFNAYMDGKTNGIANNGLLLGNEKAAFRTGVIRTQDKRLLDGDMDIRDELMNQLDQKLNEGIEGLDAVNNPAAVTEFFRFIANNRKLAKATTMQFGYGKELDSFKADMEEVIERLALSNPEEYQAALKQFGGKDTKLRDAAHAFYVDGIVNALSEEAADARAVMRANATMFALMDKVFTIKGPAGFNLNMAGMQILPTKEGIKYTVGGKTTTASLYEAKPTSAAERDGSPGRHAYGRSLPSPVQSIDASTVAQTVTGKSWEKLKQASNGNPYIHTIYDAFKVDANGYQAVLTETNKNWYKTIMRWSYLEETRDAYKKAGEAFNKELADLPNEISSKDHQGVKMMQYLLDSKDGKTINLTNRIVKTKFNPNQTPEDAGKDAKRATEFAIKTLTKMGWKPGSTTVTKEQYRWFIMFLGNQVYNLGAKNNSITEQTNKAKGKLMQKIGPRGVGVYQYYEH